MRVATCAVVVAGLFAGACASSTRREGFVSAGDREATVRGPGNEQITASTPRSVSVRRGESIPMQVFVDRQNFRGPVKVSLDQLPKGVSADRRNLTVESDTATFVLQASKTADIVRNQAVLVTLEADDGRTVKQYVDLTVLQ